MSHAQTPTLERPALVLAIKASLVVALLVVLSPLLMAPQRPLLSRLLYGIMGAMLGAEAGLLWAQWSCLRHDDGFGAQDTLHRLRAAYTWLNRALVPWCLVTAFSLVPQAGVVPELSIWLFGR